jgi:hypothetical protein
MQKCYLPQNNLITKRGATAVKKEIKTCRLRTLQRQTVLTCLMFTVQFPLVAVNTPRVSSFVTCSTFCEMNEHPKMNIKQESSAQCQSTTRNTVHIILVRRNSMNRTLNYKPFKCAIKPQNIRHFVVKYTLIFRMVYYLSLRHQGCT